MKGEGAPGNIKWGEKEEVGKGEGGKKGGMWEERKIGRGGMERDTET